MIFIAIKILSYSHKNCIYRYHSIFCFLIKAKYKYVHNCTKSSGLASEKLLSLNQSLHFYRNSF